MFANHNSSDFSSNELSEISDLSDSENDSDLFGSQQFVCNSRKYITEGNLINLLNLRTKRQ